MATIYSYISTVSILNISSNAIYYYTYLYPHIYIYIYGTDVWRTAYDTYLIKLQSSVICLIMSAPHKAHIYQDGYWFYHYKNNEYTVVLRM